jgi:hypothetical protein
VRANTSLASRASTNLTVFACVLFMRQLPLRMSQLPLFMR